MTPNIAVRDLDAASERAALEGGTPQRVEIDVVCGEGGFADDAAVRAAADVAMLVAVPQHDGYVIAPTLHEARAAAAKVQGRRTSIAHEPPLSPPEPSAGGVALATSWVEPAYLEPDASWCFPGGEPATPLANGGAFGGKVQSPVPDVARQLAREHDRPVRVVWSREDVVRHGPKRAPIAATASFDGQRVVVQGRGPRPPAVAPSPYGVDVAVSWEAVELAGPPVSDHPRAPFAESTVLVEGALSAVGFDRASCGIDGIARDVLLDNCVADPDGGLAGARVEVDAATGAVTRVSIRVAAGGVLDEVVLRSYCIGAVHMALGWVLQEGIAVDAQGVVHDLTIRSFGILRAKDMPPVDIEIVADDRAPCRASDAVFAATAAACWNALGRPTVLPARKRR